jgi:hypothetical protein
VDREATRTFPSLIASAHRARPSRRLEDRAKILREVFSRHPPQNADDSAFADWRSAVLASVNLGELKVELLSRTEYLQGWARAWAKYLTSARAHGMLEGGSGLHLLARLNGTDRRDFYSAMDECAACWLLAERLGLAVAVTPPGRGKTRLEFRASRPGLEMNVEVKSPFREPLLQTNPPFVALEVADAPVLRKRAARAAEKFATGQANVVMMFPRLTVPVSHSRNEIVRAMFGQDLIVVSRVPNPSTGRLATHRELVPNGFFMQSDERGMPLNTRVSAVVFVEQMAAHRHGPSARYSSFVHHELLVAQNPNASVPVRREEWPRVPILALQESVLSWSDGK